MSNVAQSNVAAASARLLATCKPWVDPERHEGLESLLAAGEYGVLVEILADNLAEGDRSQYSVELVSEFRDLCDAMQLQPRYWQQLAHET